MSEQANELQIIENEAKSLEEKVNNLVINTQEDLIVATDLLKMVKNRIKAVEEKRKYYKEPFIEGGKRVDNDFKPYIESLEKVKNILDRKKIVPYQLEQQRIKEEEERKCREQEAKELAEKQKLLDEMAEKTGSEFAKAESQKVEQQVEELKEEPIKVSTQVRGNFGTSGLRDNWKYEIIDSEEVPLEYKCVDDRKVKEAIKNGVREIEGLRIYNEPTSYSR